MNEIRHEGLSFHRTKDPINFAEKVFAEAWAEQNRICPGRPASTLDYLLHGQSQCHGCTSQAEATIAATVIQWLGSPVGSSFLEDVLRKIKRGQQ